MALVRTVVTAPTVTSWNGLANSSVNVASSSAIIVGTTTNVADHEIIVTINGPIAMTGSASTAVYLFAYASIDGTNWTSSNSVNELIDGNDKPIVWSANGNQAIFVGVVNLTTTTTVASISYKSKRFSMATVFGGSLPNRYVIVAEDQSGSALAASGHSIVVNELSYS